MLNNNHNKYMLNICSDENLSSIIETDIYFCFENYFKKCVVICSHINFFLANEIQIQ